MQVGTIQLKSIDTSVLGNISIENKNIKKISEIQKLDQISDQMAPTAFFLVNALKMADERKLLLQKKNSKKIAVSL